MAFGNGWLLPVIYLLGVAILVWPAVWGSHRGRRHWARHTLIWLGIGGALVLAYRLLGWGGG